MRRLATVTFLAFAFGLILIARASAGTDNWCQGCFFYASYARSSPYQHHSTFTYTHDLSGGHYVGSGVSACYGIAHAYNEATHSYSTPCLAYAVADNSTTSSGMNGNAHNNF